MKRLIGLLLFICTIVLCSCQPLDKVQKENCRWENEEFGISFVFDGYNVIEDSKKVTFMEKEYSYYIGMERHHFGFFLVDEDGEEYQYNEYSRDFIWGRYYDKDLKKVEGKDYQYEISITLDEECQYYEYCQDNGLEFPETLVLYGYAL